MKTGERGIALIKEFEGCHLTAYLCPANVWTVGYGHTGPEVVPGMTIAQEQADDLLRADLAKFERCVEASVSVPITQEQFDALVSFAFNLGCGALGKSTLLRKLNAGDDVGAADEFVKWNRAGGRVLAGLTRRREAERDLFMA